MKDYELKPQKIYLEYGRNIHRYWAGFHHSFQNLGIKTSPERPGERGFGGLPEHGFWNPKAPPWLQRSELHGHVRC
jgi:hypothetical protein